MTRYGIASFELADELAEYCGLTLAGLGVGLVLSMAATRLLTTLLYGFRPDYLPAIAAVTGILLSVAVIACLIPARRASRIDPVVALLHE